MWLRIEGGAINPNNGTALLNIEKAERLIATLTRWAEDMKTGQI